MSSQIQEDRFNKPMKISDSMLIILVSALFNPPNLFCIDLESIDPAQRDYIQNQIMPSAIAYYQTTLQIVRNTDLVQVDIACGGYDPPAYLVDTGVDADLIILVAAEYMPDVDFVAGAVPCGLSETDNRFILYTRTLVY